MTTDREARIRRARRGLWRTALFWTPLFITVAGGGTYFFIRQATGDDGYGWVLPSLLVVFGSLFGYQGIQAIRDLRGGTAMVEGFITRRWRRFDLGSRSYYLRIDGDKIIRTDRVQYDPVEQGNYVAVEYYPGSMIAVAVEKREPPEGYEPPTDEPGEPALPEPDPLLIERE